MPRTIVAAAAVVLLAWFDIIGFIKFVAFVRPYFGVAGGLAFGCVLRPKFKNARYQGGMACVNMGISAPLRTNPSPSERYSQTVVTSSPPPTTTRTTTNHLEPPTGGRHHPPPPHARPRKP